MKLINSENSKSLIFPNAQSTCAIILINLKSTCLYLLMGFNIYLGLLVQVEGAMSISTVSLVDVEVGSFSPYIFVPTPWVKHIKTIVKEGFSLKNPSHNKLDFSPRSLGAATAAVCQASVATLPLCASVEILLRQSVLSACRHHLVLAARVSALPCPEAGPTSSRSSRSCVASGQSMHEANHGWHGNLVEFVHCSSISSTSNMFSSSTS